MCSTCCRTRFYNNEAPENVCLCMPTAVIFRSVNNTQLSGCGCCFSIHLHAASSVETTIDSCFCCFTLYRTNDSHFYSVNGRKYREVVLPG